MTIIGATWADLGYRCLGPSKHLDVSRTQNLMELIKNSGFYDIQTAGDECWIRDKVRKHGASLPTIIRRAATLTSENFTNTVSYDFIDRAIRSKYAEKQGKLTDSQGQLADHIQQVWTKEPRWRSLYVLSLAVSFCNPNELADFLRLHVFPIFFGAYPKGRVVFYERNYDFERRYGLLRAMYTLSHYDLSNINRKWGFPTLRQFQRLDTIVPPKTLITLIGYTFYPFVHIVSASTSGLLVLFILDPAERHVLSDFPASWMCIPQSHWDFGNQERDHFAVLLGKDNTIAHRRFLHQRSFSAVEIETLVDWFVSRYSELAFHLVDPCEFMLNSCIDAVTTFEYGLTVDRIIRKAISCLASEENAVRKAASQEIADLLETLRMFRDSSATNAEFFKRLYHPLKGNEMVARCFEQLPAPFDNYFKNIARRLYDELLETVKSSVWIETKVTATDILVKNRDLSTENKEDIGDFVSNVIRTLRNAHHGYLSHGDQSNRPSRYLAMVKGDTPDSMAYLGIIWTLAMLASPEEILGWKWMPIGSWD